MMRPLTARIEWAGAIGTARFYDDVVGCYWVEPPEGDRSRSPWSHAAASVWRDGLLGIHRDNCRNLERRPPVVNRDEVLEALGDLERIL